MAQSLHELIERRKILLCVGAGGVGKTTVSAAIGVAAARAGRRTLVLTVDPARRLANALGLQAFTEHVQRIPVEAFAAQGCEVAVPLDAAMLDVKRTFDRVVERYARTPEGRDRILQHPFYKQASTALAGSQEYMAMERLYESASSGEYDLVVLDTPPSEHALEFLDAPNRLVDLFDSAAFRLLLGPTQKMSTGIFRKNSLVMRGLQKFTSVEMFGSLLEFFGHLSETFDGFVERARDVQAMLRSQDSAFVLVSTCDQGSTEQAGFLREHLRREQMAVGAWIVNRVAPFPTSPAAAGDELETGLASLLEAAGPDAAGGDRAAAVRTAKTMAQISRQLARLALADAALVEVVRRQAGQDLAVVPVARAEDEPDTLAGLHRMATTLQAGGHDFRAPAQG